MFAKFVKPLVHFEVLLEFLNPKQRRAEDCAP